MYIGAEAELEPGEKGRSDLARFVAGEIREIMGALPRQARLTVKAPEMPGDSYKLSLETPFSAPYIAEIVARVLLMVDEAAQRPMQAGAHVQMPPAAMCWIAAAPLLEAMGMRKLDAECYWRSLGGLGGQQLYLKLNVRDATVRGWLDRPCRGARSRCISAQTRSSVPASKGDRISRASWPGRSARS